MEVTIYSTTTCPYCQMLKDYLTEHKTIFIEKYVDEDNVAKEEMMALSDGFLGVPFTVFKKANGQTESVIGFDKKRINNILGIQQ